MSNSDFPDLKPSKSPRAHVRFTPEQYAKILCDMIETGKSIPWLLKTAYFKRGISSPSLDVEIRRKVLRELAAIGNNVNQLARAVNSGIINGSKAAIEDCIQDIRVLKSFLGADYGDR